MPSKYDKLIDAATPVTKNFIRAYPYAIVPAALALNTIGMRNTGKDNDLMDDWVTPTLIGSTLATAVPLGLGVIKGPKISANASKYLKMSKKAIIGGGLSTLSGYHIGKYIYGPIGKEMVNGFKI